MANLLYKDISSSFKPHPITGDLLVLNDIESIKQSVRNLVLISVYERVMHPEKGSQVYGLLFENDSPATRVTIRDTIKSVLKQYEPRVKVREIKVLHKDGDYKVNIIFSIIDFQVTETIELLLNRVK